MTENNPHQELLFWARHPKVATPEHLQQILDGDCIAAKCLLAGWDACPPGVLNTLLEQQENPVYRVLMAHPSLERAQRLKVQLRLVEGDACDRITAAEGQDVPLALLERLARDEDIHVRAAVARSPLFPDPFRLPLVADLIENHPEAAGLLVELDCLTPEQMEVCARQGQHAAPITLLHRPDLPESVVRILVDHHEPMVRYLAAGHPNCPLNLLYDLDECDEPSVSVACALNPRRSPEERAYRISEVVRNLIDCLRDYEDADEWVLPALQQALLNPLTPGMVRELICRSIRRWAQRCSEIAAA